MDVQEAANTLTAFIAAQPDDTPGLAQARLAAKKVAREIGLQGEHARATLVRMNGAVR